MTVRINASSAGLTETVDTSGTLEIQTANTSAIIIDASQNANFTSTGAIILPTGTTDQRPTGVNGMMRYNSNTSKIEVFVASAWANVSTA
jgi:UDP-N-acetylmuramyl pentapeptide synthase